MTGWQANASTLNIPIGSATGSPAVGDLALMLHTHEGGSGLSDTAGWTKPVNYFSGAHGFEARWKAVTADDLITPHAFTFQGEADFTTWVGIYRGVDLSSPIAAWNHQESPGHSSDVAVTVPSGNRYRLIEAFCDWAANWSNTDWTGTGPAGTPYSTFTKRYYSPTPRWEASMGVYEKDAFVTDGSVSMGLESFGTRNYRIVIALREGVIITPLWTDEGSASAMVMG